MSHRQPMGFRIPPTIKTPQRGRRFRQGPLPTNTPPPAPRQGQRTRRSIHDNAPSTDSSKPAYWRTGRPHEHQPPIPQRLAQGTTTQTSARSLRHMRDLRATSRQNTAHTAPVERRGRRDHPRVTRRRPIGMGQRAPDTPTLQPAQKQPQRRLRASAAHTNTTTESDKPSTKHEHMVNTNNPTELSQQTGHTPREGTRPAPSRGPRAKRRYTHRNSVKSQSDVLKRKEQS